MARVMLPTIANESRKNKALELFGTKEYEVTTAIAQISKRFLIIGNKEQEVMFRCNEEHSLFWAFHLWRTKRHTWF